MAPGIPTDLKEKAIEVLKGGGSFKLDITQKGHVMFTLILKGFVITITAHTPKGDVMCEIPTTGRPEQRFDRFESLAQCLTAGISYPVYSSTL